MKARLWLKKALRKLIVDWKGFSSVVGAVFMVLVVMVLSTGVFLWTLSQNTIYNQAVKESNQLDVERLNEKVTASNVNYTVSAGKVYVNVTVSNEGSLSARIVTLWVLDTSIQAYGFNDTLDIDLNPGETINLRGESAIVVTVPGSSSAHDFSSWFVTARGNTIPVKKEQGVIVAQLSQGIGSMAIDFYTFRYFTYNDSKLVNYPEGNSNFTVPSGTDIAFGVYLTNLDPQKKTIVLNMFSELWLYFPKSPGTNPQWYIVNVASDGSVNSTYSAVSIGYAETKLLIFASSNAGDFSPQSISASVKGLPCAVNLLLQGKIGTRDYGQNIPFVSLYVES